MGEIEKKPFGGDRKRSASDERPEISWFAWKRGTGAAMPLRLGAVQVPAQGS
jgi:hypothetical protein